MGEQRPGETLNRFIDAALPRGANGEARFYSRADTVSGSYEARRLLAPAQLPDYRQTEFFEYHWAHLMQGNRLDDLWPTFRRMLLSSPKRVPHGLKIVWLLTWLLIFTAALLLSPWGPWSTLAFTDSGIEAIVRAILGAGVAATALSYLLSRLLPNWLTSNFVDVVRYLDTSPRSYEARRQIRKGFIDLLTGLHNSTRTLSNGTKVDHYDRIVIVAHSLGAYIAYDGISFLWGEMNYRINKDATRLDGKEEMENAIVALKQAAAKPSGTDLTNFHAAQRRLWRGLQANGNRWRVTDFVTVGTPMYFADRLFTRDRDSFNQLIERGELPVCPPIWNQDLSITAKDGNTNRSLTWTGRPILHEAAPFAVVRWTNTWFPPALGFFGDWFGGGLADLFGKGVRDIPIRGNTSYGRGKWLSGRLFPALAHSRYFKFVHDTGDDSVTKILRDTLDLAARSFDGPPTGSTVLSAAASEAKTEPAD